MYWLIGHNLFVVIVVVLFSSAKHYPTTAIHIAIFFLTSCLRKLSPISLAVQVVERPNGKDCI